MADKTQYFWVVACKNHHFHGKENQFFSHKIRLGETDEIADPPAIGYFVAECDDCGKEYSYEAKDLLRLELPVPAGFTAHPLFR